MSLLMKFNKIKFLNCLIVAVMIVYWGANILISSPYNLMRFETQTLLDKLPYLEQYWSFFAPPPQYNTRLYYDYFDENKDIIKRIEILEELYQNKSKKAPFNFNEQALDYCLQSSIHQIYKTLNIDDPKDITKRYEIVKESHNFKILYNYSQIINEKVDEKFCYVMITIAEEH